MIHCASIIVYICHSILTPNLFSLPAQPISHSFSLCINPSRIHFLSASTHHQPSRSRTNNNHSQQLVSICNLHLPAIFFVSRSPSHGYHTQLPPPISASLLPPATTTSHSPSTHHCSQLLPPIFCFSICVRNHHSSSSSLPPNHACEHPHFTLLSPRLRPRRSNHCLDHSNGSAALFSLTSIAVYICLINP